MDTHNPKLLGVVALANELYQIFKEEIMPTYTNFFR